MRLINSPLTFLTLHISCAAAVASISQNADGVTVNTTDGQTYTADYVIVTVSLGVLKAGMLTFQPPLPAEKAAAIREMVGYDIVHTQSWVRSSAC